MGEIVSHGGVDDKRTIKRLAGYRLPASGHPISLQTDAIEDLAARLSDGRNETISSKKGGYGLRLPSWV